LRRPLQIPLLVVRGYPRTGCSIALAAHSGPEQFGSQLGARSADVLPACVQSAGLPAADGEVSAWIRPTPPLLR